MWLDTSPAKAATTGGEEHGKQPLPGAGVKMLSRASVQAQVSCPRPKCALTPCLTLSSRLPVSRASLTCKPADNGMACARSMRSTSVWAFLCVRPNQPRERAEGRGLRRSSQGGYLRVPALAVV